MLRRKTLSVVSFPGDVLYFGFLSAVTAELIILLCSSGEKAMSMKSSLSHLRSEQVSHRVSFRLSAYGLPSSPYWLIRRALSPSLARTSHSMSSFPFEASLSCSYVPSITISPTLRVSSSGVFGGSVFPSLIAYHPISSSSHPIETRETLI